MVCFSVCEVGALALLCLGNLLRTLDNEQLGGAEHIYQLWQRLVSMATSQRSKSLNIMFLGFKVTLTLKVG